MKTRKKIQLVPHPNLPKTGILNIILSLIFLACSEEHENVDVQQFDAAVAGQTIELVFSTANAGSPYSVNQIISVSFSANGALFIDQDPEMQNGNEIEMNDFVKIGSEYQWKDGISNHLYTLSLQSDGSVNELNLNASNGQFLGQFTVFDEDSNELAIIQALEGTYQVSTIDRGVHDRMSVIIDSDGNIDFDTDAVLKSSDFQLVTDRVSELNSIFIDMTPYPSEPYPRVELLLDANGSLSQVAYYPEYPSISGRSVVNF